MFINFEDIDSNMVTIDVRTKKEFEEMPLFQYNIEIINEDEHKKIKQCYPIAIFIIFKALFNKRKVIRKELIKLSENKKKKLVFGCSRGRLRSPFMYLYARMLNIECFILKKGIKRFFYKEINKKGILERIYDYMTFK
ncbi:hypothetical protein [Clostridium sp.]|uniref:hypothetical protein n=1 Tax=Clostridium sp. TaxID=1506 RepID=UPI003995EAA7